MSEDAFPARNDHGEVVRRQIRLTGNGAADPTKNLGRGVTVKWISTGLYELAWTENPGSYVGHNPSFQATTPSQLAGYTCPAGDYDATNFKLRVSVYNSTFALADLTSTQKLSLGVEFRLSSV